MSNLLQDCGLTTRALEAFRLDSFQPEPSIPESFKQALDSFAERFGLRLRMVWQPWYGFWSIHSRELTFDFRREEWRDKDLPFFDCVEDDGNPMQLGERVIEVIGAGYVGDTPTEKKQHFERQAEQRKKDEAEKGQNLIEKSLDDGEEYLRRVRDHMSIEAIQMRDKVVSLPDMSPDGMRIVDKRAKGEPA